jgi:YidC/Oxa1 family membrane protein insertase
MSAFFQTILYQPIFNGFVGLYNIIPDVGVVILIVTVISKLVLYPLTSASIKAQKAMLELQPKMDALKAKHKGDQQTLGQETMKLYKENKVNPLGSCLPILVQLPIFIALYWVLQAGLASNHFELLYPFVKNPGHINTMTLWLIDLSKASVVLAALAGLAQFWQAKMMMTKQPPKSAGAGGKDEGMAAMMNKQMLYVMPVMTFAIGFTLPAGLSLYWFFSTILTALQQKVVFQRQNGGKKPDGVIEGVVVGDKK